MADRWLPIPGYEGLYSISDVGAVRSEARFVESYGGRRRPVAARLLRPRIKSGYFCVELYSSGIGHWRGAHTLVAEAFIGPRPGGLYVCHNDGCKTNNNLANLRYDTPASNQADRKAHGTDRALCGEESPVSKLTCDEVRRIRMDHRSARIGAAEYGISISQFNRVRRGEDWKAVL